MRLTMMALTHAQWNERSGSCGLAGWVADPTYEAACSFAHGTLNIPVFFPTAHLLFPMSAVLDANPESTRTHG